MEMEKQMEKQIEEILKRKGVSPLLTEEEFMKKLGEKMEIVLPSLVIRIANGILDEELTKMGRSKACRYWHKTEGRCRKGFNCMDCDAYEQRRWWQFSWKDFALSSSIEYLIIGMGVACTIGAILSPKVALQVLCIWLGIIIVSRIQIMVQKKDLRRLYGI